MPSRQRVCSGVPWRVSHGAVACDTYAVTLVVPGCLAFISPTKMGVGTTPASSPDIMRLSILVLCEAMRCHVVGWPLAVCQGRSAVTSNQGPGSRLLRAWASVLSHGRAWSPATRVQAVESMGVSA